MDICLRCTRGVRQRNDHGPADHPQPETPPEILFGRLPLHLSNFVKSPCHQSANYENDRQNKNQKQHCPDHLSKILQCEHGIAPAPASTLSATSSLSSGTISPPPESAAISFYCFFTPSRPISNRVFFILYGIFSYEYRNQY